MKRSVLLSLAILGMILQNASAVTGPVSLYTTTEDLSQFQNEWVNVSPTISLGPLTDADGSAINGAANMTNPGGAGTPGALVISPNGGWTLYMGQENLGGNQAFLNTVDPGAVANTSVANAIGVFGFDYQFNTAPNTWFQFGIWSDYKMHTGSDQWSQTFVNSDYSYTGADGSVWNHVDVPYSIHAGTGAGGLDYFKFGLFGNTGGLTSSMTVDNFTVTYLDVPEPGTFVLAGLGVAALLIFRRK